MLISPLGGYAAAAAAAKRKWFGNESLAPLSNEARTAPFNQKVSCLNICARLE